MSGGLTGALYKSTAGVRSCGAAAAFGSTLAAAWAYLLKNDERVANYV